MVGEVRANDIDYQFWDTILKLLETIQPVVQAGRINEAGRIVPNDQVFVRESDPTTVAASSNVDVLTITQAQARPYRRMMLKIDTPINNTSYDFHMFLGGIAIRDTTGTQLWVDTNNATIGGYLYGGTALLPQGVGDFTVNIANDDGAVDMTAVVVAAYLYDPY